LRSCVANVNPRIEGERAWQHFVDRSRRRSARSTFFPSGQHFVDRSCDAAIGSTKLPLAQLKFEAQIG
jgi:hypothetical protein